MFTINEKCLNKNISDETIEPKFYKYSGLDKLEINIDR